MKMISFTSSPSYILRSSKNKKPAVASPRLPAFSLTVLLFGQRFLARVLRKPAGVLQPRLLVVTRDGVERRLCHRLLQSHGRQRSPAPLSHTSGPPISLS